MTAELEDAGRYAEPESDASGRLDPMAHESLTGGTPEERADDVELSLRARRKWRKLPTGQLECPLCGAPVRDDWRPRGQHVDFHKDLERVRAAVGLSPGGSLTYDYAAMHERMRHHAVAWCAVALLSLLIIAILLYLLTS